MLMLIRTQNQLQEKKNTTYFRQRRWDSFTSFQSSSMTTRSIAIDSRERDHHRHHRRSMRARWSLRCCCSKNYIWRHDRVICNFRNISRNALRRDDTSRTNANRDVFVDKRRKRHLSTLRDFEWESHWCTSVYDIEFDQSWWRLVRRRSIVRAMSKLLLFVRSEHRAAATAHRSTKSSDSRLRRRELDWRTK